MALQDSKGTISGSGEIRKASSRNIELKKGSSRNIELKKDSTRLIEGSIQRIDESKKESDDRSKNKILTQETERNGM